MKYILILLLTASNLMAEMPYPVVEKTGEDARMFALVNYKPADVSHFRIDIHPLEGKDLDIFKTIAKYWESKTGAKLASRVDADGWSNITFIALIKGDRVRFSTTDNSAGPLSFGILDECSDEELGVLKKKNGKWVVVKDDKLF